MPSRYDVFYSGGIYHTFNKTIDHRIIFSEDISNKFTDIFCYYRSEISAKLRYSYLKRLPFNLFEKKMTDIFIKKYFMVEIIAFCLLPNHFHFALRENKEGGIIKFMSNIANSITRFYNEKNSRKGPIFLPQFKSKQVTSQEGLNYLSRYIHTNCYAHEVVRSRDKILDYTYSSIGAYISANNNLKIETDRVMNSFGNKPDRYKKFILNNAEDQKMYEKVKYTRDWLRG